MEFPCVCFSRICQNFLTVVTIVHVNNFLNLKNFYSIVNAENIEIMASSVPISVEVPNENQIQEIGYDGTETYQS